MAASDLTAARLRELLHYNPETGVFIWRVFRCGRAMPGAVAGRKTGGYWCINIDGKTHKAARLAWLYVTGDWPEHVVDHRDTNKLNNCWGNLRDITQPNNLQNQRRARSDNLLGLLGVTKHAKNNKFQARITLDKKTLSLGYFHTPDEAHAAYVEAKRRLHPGCTI